MRSHLGRVGVLLLGIASTVSVPSNGTAQSKQPQVRDDVITFAAKPASEFTTDYRAKFVHALANYCQDVLTALPTNTPAEDDWVSSEQRTRDASKIQRLLKSKEYSRSMLKKTFSDCEGTTTLLIQVENDIRAKRTETIARFEAEQFIDLALTFNASLESYSSRLELSRDLNVALADFYLFVIRQGLLKAATKALQEAQ